MKHLRLPALAALAFGAWLGIGSLDQGRPGIGAAQAAGGCGIGFHRGPYGGCRPNVYGAPGYYGYRGGATYGYRGGAVYGGRVYRGGRVYGGRAVYGRRVGAYRGGRVYGGGRFRR